MPDAIWDVALGGLTDGEPMFFTFGNPTRNTGRFRETHGRLKHRWITRQIDSRTVEGTSKVLFTEWEEDSGADGDFFRVRVRGLFPRASSLQFIDTDSVAEAMRRTPAHGSDDPLVLGIDIARGGGDNNVIWFRGGMDARTIPPIRIPGEQTRDTTRMIAKIVTTIEEHKPDAVFVDGTGVGGPLVDRLRQLGFDVFEVQFGGSAPDRKYANMAAYMWSRTKDALKTGLALPEDYDLEAQLTGREYTHDAKDRLVLEKKEHMKARGLASPDDADALGLTFAMAVMKKHRGGGHKVGKAEKDYDPLAE